MKKLGAPKNKYYRYHRFHLLTNQKQIKSFPRDMDIKDLPIDIDYTPYIKGNGPFTKEVYNKLLVHIDTHFTGKPKRSETKQKMRLKKLGTKHTPEHNLKIKLSHKYKLRKKND